MTVILGKTQIHLGWPAAGSIIFGVVVATWGASWSVDSFIHSQANIIKSQSEIKSVLGIWSKRDSLYFAKTDKNSADIDSLKRSLINNKPTHWYTERVVNGHVVLERVNN